MSISKLPDHRVGTQARPARPRPPEPIWSNFPEWLIALHIWCPWRFEWDAGRGAWTKIFYQIDGRKARSNDPATWASYEFAQSSYFAPHPDGGRPYDGVGICLSTGLGITALDADRDKQTGKVDPRVHEIVARLDTYCELSPSGGIRALCFAILPPKDRRIGLIELYCDKRFMTLTGDLMLDATGEINPRQDVINAIHGELFASRKARAAPRPAVQVSLGDTELIERACKASGRFDDLFHNDWKGEDQSAQDMWLASRLAFWFGRDAARMDRVFRASALYRRKWDRNSYGQRTLDQAIAGCAEVYRETRRQNPAHRNTRTEEIMSHEVEVMEQAPPSDDEVSEPISQDTHSNQGTPAHPKVVSIVRQGKKTEKPKPPPRDPNRTRIVASRRQLGPILKEAMNALIKHNVPAPEAFIRGGALAYIRLSRNTKAPVIEEYQKAKMRLRLSQVADWQTDTKDDSYDDAPPDKVIDTVLVAHEHFESFPEIDGVVSAPIFTPEGTLISTKGYHPSLAVYYHDGLKVTLPDIPEEPTPEQLKAAVKYIDDEIFCDFPFRARSGRAHAFAALLLPPLRRVIDGPSPIHVAEAPTPRTGKGLLFEVIAMISAGGARTTKLNRNDDEVEKKLTPLIIGGVPIVQFDNVTGHVESAALSMATTEATWNGRLLGHSEMTEAIPIRTIWFITGNNVDFADDLAGRGVPIIIDANSANPESRTGFHHKRLTAWVREHLGELRAAVLTICRAWFTAGCPKWEGAALGRYEDWSAVIGGVLQHAGIEGFLEDRNQWAAEADTERPFWETFVGAWADEYGFTKASEPPNQLDPHTLVTAARLLELAQRDELLPNVLGRAKTKRGEALVLGKALKGRIYSVILGYKLLLGEPDKHGTASYYLRQLVEPPSENPENGK